MKHCVESVGKLVEVSLKIWIGSYFVNQLQLLR